MDTFVRNFIRAALIWLGVGALLGLWMVFEPNAVIYRPAHMHANLLGFVSMMIFGVAYHVLPRFAGSPLWSRGMAAVHLWAANAGLSLMVCGWLVRPHLGVYQALLAVGGLCSAAGAFLFITNIWRTVGSGAPQPVQLAARRT